MSEKPVRRPSRHEKMREIVTLQLGNYSNYIGSHFWNIEDELNIFNQRGEGSERVDVDANILFRTSEVDGNVILTPRCLVHDLSGGFGALSAQGSLEPTLTLTENSGNEQETWRGQTQMCVSDTIEKHAYISALEMEEEQARKELERRQYSNKPAKSSVLVEQPDPTALLNGNVRYWSDFSKVIFLQRNLYQLPGLHHQVNPFDYYTQGVAFMKRETIFDDVSDKLRMLIEECDSLAGFHCLVDVDTAFAGVTESILLLIAEEYGNKNTITFASLAQPSPNPVNTAMTQAKTSLNTAFAVSRLSNLSSLYVPLYSAAFQTPVVRQLSPLSDELYLSRLRVDANQPYHTSALLATAIHNLTLPYRSRRCDLSKANPHQMSSPPDSLHEFCRRAGGDRQLPVACVSMALPLPDDFHVLDTNCLASSPPSFFSPGAATSPAFYRCSYMTPLSLPQSLPGQLPEVVDTVFSEHITSRGLGLLELTGTRAVQNAGQTADSRMAVRENGGVGSEAVIAGGALSLSDKYERFVSQVQANDCPNRAISNIVNPFPVPLPYPPIFASPYAQLPIMTSLFTSAGQFATLAEVQDLMEAVAKSKKLGDRSHLKEGFGKTVMQMEKEGMENDDWFVLLFILDGTRLHKTLPNSLNCMLRGKHTMQA